MENSVCSKCQKPLVTSEEIIRRLCAGCAKSAERTGYGGPDRYDGSDRCIWSAESAASAEYPEHSKYSKYPAYPEGGARDAEGEGPVRSGICPESGIRSASGIRPACGYHPDAEAVGICGRCGTFICDECRLDRIDPATGETNHYCRDCYGRVEEASYYCAWEDKSIFFYKRFWLTWREVILHPHNFFDKLPRVADKTPALTFSYVSFAHALVLSVIFFSASPLYPFSSLLSSLPGLMTRTVGLIALTTLWLVAVPVILFGSAAYIHLGIRMQFKKRDFHQTFRIVGYASATQVVGAIPLVSGFLISVLAGILNTIIVLSGLKRLQKLSNGSVILALLLVPSLIALALVILVVAIGMMDIMKIW